MPYPATSNARKNGRQTVSNGRQAVSNGNGHARTPAAGNRFPALKENSRDATRRQLAEEALQIEKEKLRSVINAMTDTLTILNRDFDIMFQNERSRASSGDHLGEKCYRAYEHREKPCEDCPVAMAFRDGQPHTSEKKNLWPSGEVAFWENTANPVTDASGNVVICLEIGHDVTERKKAEKALQESQKFVASLLENAPHATVVINADTSVRYVNPAWERANGWTLAEVVGLKAPYPWWGDQFGEDFVPTYLEALQQPSGKGELIALKKNGEPYWIEMNWVSVAEDGEFQYAIINSVDITERKKAEERRQAILQTALDGFWICDLHGKFLEVNDSYCAMIGYTREELLKMSISDIEAVEKPGETAQRIKKIVEQGSDRFETQHRGKDGRVIDMEISVKYHNIDEGQLTVFVRDITGRNKNQKALRESEEKFSKAFQVSPAMIAITTIKDGKYIDVNDSYTLSTGYSRKELLGNTATDLNIWVRPDDRHEMFKLLREQGKVHNQEIDFRMKSGEVRTWLFSAEPIDIKGEPCLMGVSVDITERKLMEESLANEAIRRRILIEQSRDGIVILDQNGAVYEANRRFAEMLGYTPEEVLSLNVWDWEFLYPPEKVKDMISAVDEAGDHFETQHRRKDGSIYDVEISTNGAIIAGQKLIFCVCRDITERKRAEEKRQAILQTALDGFCITDLTGKFIEVNDAYCAMTGYSREELVKLAIYDLEEHFSPRQIDKLAQKIVDDGQFRGETQYRRKDGRIIDVEISSRYLNSGEAQVYSFVHDITNRKKAEKALKESEEKFSKAFHASPGSISISRLSDGKLVEVNESFLRDKGYTRAEVIGRSTLDLHVWENIDDRERIIKDLQQGKKVRNEVVQYRTKSGVLKTGLVSAEKISIGNEPCILILNNDITQQKKAEEQLRLLSSVTQQVTDSIMITDPRFKIIYMNKAARDMFGYSIDELRGKDLASFHVNPPARQTNLKVRDTIKQGKVWCQTIPKRRKDGSTIICDCRLSPLYDEKGNVISYIDVQRDVTEQKAVEVKLQAQNQLIENILATMLEGVLVVDAEDRIILANESAHQIFHRRSHSLKNRLLKDIIPVESLLNLYQGVKQGNKGENTLEFRYHTRNIDITVVCGAVRMDKERTLLTFTDVSREREEKERLYLTDRLASIGEMAVGLAHELNNPLTGILSLSQLLIDSDIPPDSRDDLRSINSEAKRAASIVKNVLVFTRNNTYENGQSSVNEVIRNVLRLREYEENTSNIKVITKLQEALPEVQIDQYQLQQVFLNLILNAEAAIKDAGRPGILSINTSRAGTYVDVAITDNGCGIKKNVLPRIFDPFFTTKEIGKGTGLGLSICYGIISKHGGKISVATRVNQGSTFTVRIPAVPE
jgi:PAS domain S-box-containing protein